MSYVDEKANIRLLEISCYEYCNDFSPEPDICHIIDDTGDPNFYCEFCDLECSHTVITDVKDNKYHPKHTVKIIGVCTIKELREWLESRD